MGKIVFSKAITEKINKEYLEALELFGSCRAEVAERVEKLLGDEKLFMKYMYAHMPLSDVGAYDFDVILSYASHAVFLLENSEFLEGVSEEYFLQYVLAYRINSEDITDCRRFFYDLVHERAKGMTRAEAVLEVNNWCYEQATYRSTSIRTQSPITMYKSGFGRCGEESTFLTTILRSLGIPARQVYVPRWSHSDSNHAWVEVWCEDGWHFTGACEPKPILDNGWFPYAASRAMVVHSRLFDSEESTDEEVTERDGLAVLLNESARYMNPVPFKVSVLDDKNAPVAGAEVRFEIINSSEFFPVAALKTGKDGSCNINLGRGEVHVQVLSEGRTKDAFADLREVRELTVKLDGSEYEKESWIRYHINAPESEGLAGNELTPEMDAAQNAKNAIGDKIRNDRINSYFDEEYTKHFAEYKNLDKVLRNSKGNFENIRAFIDKEYPGITLAMKDMTVAGLSEKDARDIKPEVLEDALAAFEFRGGLPEDVFTYALLSPRIYFETATAYRSYIKKTHPEYEKLVKEGPAILWAKLNEEITYYPEKEYTTILSVPEGALKVGSCTPLSLGILFIAICRTFGVPARMDMLFGEPMYYENGEFKYARSEFEATAKLELTCHDEKMPDYEQSFSIGRKNEAGAYETIGAWFKRFENGVFSLDIAPGDYRILTCERRASGSITGKFLYFTARNGEKKSFEMSCNELRPEDFITRCDIPEVKAVSFVTGKEFTADDMGEKRGLMFIAEPGKEPTEHVFNELLEISRMGGFPECEINLVLRGEKAMADSTLDKIRDTYKNINICFADFESILPGLEKATGVASRNLPYICVTEGKCESIYCCSGYNVGCVDVFAKLIRG